MKTVGEILKTARMEKKLTLEEISARTKIGLPYLEALENNDFKHLPAAAFTKGFVRNYAQVVEINPKEVLAIFRRDYDQDNQGKVIPRSVAEPVKAPLNLFTPTTTAIALSVTIGVVIIAFFIRQIMVFLSAPPLTVSEPLDQAQVVSPVMITGKTKPEATVTVNNKPVVVDESGNFNMTLELTDGSHTLVVSASSRSGKATIVQRFVTVLNPTSPTP